MARRYRHRQKQNIGWKVIVAILAFIGLLFIIDNIAGTNMLQTMWNAFISFIRQVASMLGGGK